MGMISILVSIAFKYITLSWIPFPSPLVAGASSKLAIPRGVLGYTTEVTIWQVAVFKHAY